MATETCALKGIRSLVIPAGGRLMPQVIRVTATWQHRADRRRLLALIDDAFDEWQIARG